MLSIGRTATLVRISWPSSTDAVPPNAIDQSGVREYEMNQYAIAAAAAVVRGEITQ